LVKCYLDCTLSPWRRQPLLQHEAVVEQEMFDGQKRVSRRSAEPRSNNSSSGSVGNKMGSEYVSLEDLAPLAMDKIEALSMEGLRIQSGMTDEDAPANISAKSIGDVSALQGKGINISGSVGLEGAAGLQLLDIEDGGDDVDGLMGLSLSLDEWMRFDSGEIDDDDCISERTSKILAAHHANSLDLIRGGSKGERRRGKGSSRKCGLLGNNFTVALMVQLRDPLRNYEPVGAPMLALIQVERVFVPPKPKIYSTVSEVRNSNEDDESESAVVETKTETKEEKTSEEEGIPQFRITEVHVAGLKTEPTKKKLWGTSTQQQSGSRWLVANGMGKSNKHPFMKSKAVAKSAAPATMKVQPGDTLWSISSRVHGTGAKWKDLAALNPHIRNPNIILPNETIRLR
jgi:LysM repeat protein